MKTPARRPCTSIHLASLSLLVVGLWLSRAETAHAASEYSSLDSTTGLFSIGPRFGTTGLGVDLTFPLGESTRLRFIGSTGNFSYDGELSDVNYAFEISTPTLGGVLDWHPGGGAFRLSLGGFYSGIEADGSASPTDSVDIGNGTYPAAAVGVLDATLKYPSGMGYVGFGFGDSMKGNRWTVSLDVGLLVGPSPDFSLTSRDGLLSNDPAFRAEVAREEQEIREDVTDRLQFYPVITLGLCFRF